MKYVVKVYGANNKCCGFIKSIRHVNGNIKIIGVVRAEDARKFRSENEVQGVFDEIVPWGIKEGFSFSYEPYQ